MATSTTQNWKRGLFLIGLPCLALAAVLSLRLMERPQADAPEPEEDSQAEADAAEPTFIELANARIVSGAGIATAAVEEHAFESTIGCSGHVTFNSNTYVKVAPKAAGILREIPVDVGTRVAAGDLLAVIDSQAVGDLKAHLHKARIHEEHSIWLIAMYKEASAGIATAKVREEEHMLEEERTETRRIKQRLLEYGYTPKQIDQVVDQHDYSIRLSVLAPRGGTIVDRHAVDGEAVDITQSLFAIADLDTMWVQLNVYETHLPHVRIGQTMTFYPDGLDGAGFSGKITWTSPEVDPQTRTATLRAELDNRDGKLLANMYGRAELHLNKEGSRAAVPSSAVQLHNGQHVVFVRKSETLFDVRKVEIGQKRETLWEVTSGLAPGEIVATTGSFLLKSNLENPEFGSVE